MNMLDELIRIVDMGGPVIVLLLIMSLVAVAVVLAKIWHFLRAGVGRHAGLESALAHWDSGARAAAVAQAGAASNHLALLGVTAMQAAARPGTDTSALRARLNGMAAERLAVLSSGLRVLDSIAQIAPLVGLFGTVVGMIEAFQAMQAVSGAVDPSVLAGGIWVALLTTAVGLAVAMPASLLVTWFDGRIAREALLAERIIDTVFCAGIGAPGSARPEARPMEAAHA
ncbi:MAG: MotA/TolQ/ExbB proton channel family protein [Gemmobacter sp.]